jgi:drug/metabolite transporter (DMT)-like permease
MPVPVNILGIVFALTSSFVWGAGDFTGGFATRRTHQFQVLALSAGSGLAVLIAAARVLGESFPSPTSIAWAARGGAAGGLGIAALYRALSIGQNASVAPTAAVIGAAMPVVVGAFSLGLPAPSQLVGFALALAGIALISSSPRAAGAAAGTSRSSLLLACLAGVGFGGFFIFLGQVESGKILTPLIISRSLTLLTGLALMRFKRLPLPPLRANPIALLAGLLDAGGNLFYILARQYTRLDIAAVLSSLYPASTILLAGLILKEKASWGQWAGAALCLAAIALITL